MTASVPRVPRRFRAADYQRMVWQHYANRIATYLRWVALFALMPEVFTIIQYHFPVWPDIATGVTFAVHQIAGWVQRKTEMYRIDL